MYQQNENQGGNRQQNPPPAYHRDSSSLMATAALICAILGIVSSCCLYGAFVFGGLAIIFGLLSRGGHKKPRGAARTAIFTGIIALVISVTITVMSFVIAIAQYGSIQNLMDVYTNTLEENFGIDLDGTEDVPTDFYGDSDFL